MPQSLVENHIQTATGGSVKESATGNRKIEHFFKAHRLRAELNPVAEVGLWLAAFVLDREWLVLMKLYDVGLSRQPQTQTAQAEAPANLHARARLLALLMSGFMEKIAFGGKSILRPLLFEVN